MMQTDAQICGGKAVLRKWGTLRKLCWMSDIHLDCADDFSRWCFFDQLSMSDFDAAIVTGDISNSEQLEQHLRDLAKACAPRPVFFVLGNHDFFFSGFEEVERMVDAVCRTEENLVHLGKGEIVSLGENTALIGHCGWADGQAGWGECTNVPSSDHELIRDFKEISETARFKKMAVLGAESATYFREILPYCLARFAHVIVATHVPPFVQSVKYQGRPCDQAHLPHFSNTSTGKVIGGIARRTGKKITVLCGHTHFSAEIQLSQRL